MRRGQVTEIDEVRGGLRAHPCGLSQAEAGGAGCSERTFRRGGPLRGGGSRRYSTTAAWAASPRRPSISRAPLGQPDRARTQIAGRRYDVLWRDNAGQIAS